MLEEPDKDECLLAWVYRRSLTMAKTDTHCFRWKNGKALRLAIDKSKCEVKEAALQAAWVAKLKREQDIPVYRMKEIIILSDYDDKEYGIYTSSDDDQDPPTATDGFSCVGDRKGKRPVTPPPPTPSHCLYLF
ncbi:Phosphorylated carbohydrates phosphatase [Hordeum vulgare]|nr:Phosphorylated carbohydrates phosphatase [Hordeum vulgare]